MKSSYLWKNLFIAQNNPPLGQIIRTHLKRYAIPWQQADIVDAHPAGNMGEDFMSIIETDAKGGARQCLYDFPFYPYQFLIVGHILLFRKTSLCNAKKEKRRKLEAINPRS